ncbi:hypothetical protein [Burkholderia sp. NRF60-BP8]|uniref:hypothetical protein n=1 Tax=Burkholderia sp. NRF60-BP8 TaxID=1637853 RepID=UPI00131EFEBA|nr:hypothetical protein [Burkholderia sp. NRF60-BP8]
MANRQLVRTSLLDLAGISREPKKSALTSRPVRMLESTKTDENPIAMDAVKRFMIRWIHFNPLARRFGGGCTGIVMAATAKTALFAIIHAVVLGVTDIGTLSSWLASTAVMFVVMLAGEVLGQWVHRR